MARVVVRMFATVREAAGVASCEAEAEDVAELLERLSESFGNELAGVFRRLKGDPDGLVVLLNGKNVSRAELSRTKLKDSDEVSIFPPVSGG